MTAPTPRSLSSNESFSWADRSGTANMDEASAHLDRLALGQQQEQEHNDGPPTLPFDGDDFPEALALPVLVPRATKQGRRELGETSATLMDFVSHMSLDEARRSAAASFANHASAPSLGAERGLCTRDRSSSCGHDDDGDDEDVVTTLRARINSFSQVPPASWSLTTPETVKPMVSTPQALRLGGGAQKRKSPTQPIHSTPVNGNPPLMLPSLNTGNSATRTGTFSSYSSSSQSQVAAGGRSMKKAKNYTSMLSGAPMLPSSPDLEDRDRPMAAPLRRYQAPYTTPVGGVTLVNPNLMRRAAPSTPAAATPQQPSRQSVALPTAGLPSLDEAERSAPKWLRMKRRTSLLCALRLAVTET